MPKPTSSYYQPTVVIPNRDPNNKRTPSVLVLLNGVWTIV